jgi:hypothetical protein
MEAPFFLNFSFDLDCAPLILYNSHPFWLEEMIIFVPRRQPFDNLSRLTHFCIN